jgi:hypothetical protein
MIYDTTLRDLYGWCGQFEAKVRIVYAVDTRPDRRSPVGNPWIDIFHVWVQSLDGDGWHKTRAQLQEARWLLIADMMAYRAVIKEVEELESGLLIDELLTHASNTETSNGQ